MLIRNRGTGTVSRTKELDEAWEQRNQYWSQPFVETEPLDLHRRHIYTMSLSPEIYELINRGSARSSESSVSKQQLTACLYMFSNQKQQQQQEMADLSAAIVERQSNDKLHKISRSLSQTRTLRPVSASDETARENSLEKRQRIPTANQPPSS